MDGWVYLCDDLGRLIAEGAWDIKTGNPSGTGMDIASGWSWFDIVYLQATLSILQKDSRNTERVRSDIAFETSRSTLPVFQTNYCPAIAASSRRSPFYALTAAAAWGSSTAPTPSAEVFVSG